MTDQPAFPNYFENSISGMSLRDYFAGQAIAGLGSFEANDDQMARWAYRLADAMLEEREK